MNLKSYCKVNLYLEVVNKRADGYHNIDTLFQAVSLHDTIRFEDADNDITIDCNIKAINNKDNILWQVIKNISPYLPPDRRGLNIILNKQVPMGAGLGGGSANAATVLLGLNQYYQLNLDDATLLKIASCLGADVPFFIKGGIARGQGIGEKLTFYKNSHCPLTFLIIYPKINISTKEAYEGINFRKSVNAKMQNLIQGLENNDLNTIAANVYNQFEHSQFKNYPLLQEIKDLLKQNGAKAALMSGSGSSVFGLFDSNSSAAKAKDNLAHLNYDFFLAQSIKMDLP